MTADPSRPTHEPRPPVVPLHVVTYGHPAGLEVPDDIVHVAAGVWARAAARRDDRSEPGTSVVEKAVSGVRRRLVLEGSVILVARDDDAVVGFALGSPTPSAWELYYLAVDPDAWGRGVAGVLLAAVDDHAGSVGRDQLELWVIDDNSRAAAVYERAGWVTTDDLVTDAPSGRRERRMVRRLP